VSSEHLDQVARVYSPRHYGVYEFLDRSLAPRGPEMLFDVAALYLKPESPILDIGCRDAKYLIRLVQTHGCVGVGIDPVEWHVEQARSAVEEAGLGERVRIEQRVMEELGQSSDHFDLIWSRDMLVLVEGLEQGLREAARVLKPDGVMLVYTNLATELLHSQEAARINEPLGNVARNFDEQVVEAAFEQAGLVIDQKDVIGTEWREYEEERERPVSQSLLRLARLRRSRDEFVEQYGRERYELAEASLHWLAYQLLGKLRPTLYILKRT
jgi:cyclopropane fatty-acyl-phospholipid synthase-like methyltransferase